MRYLSVCSGIEAATVAWHPIGWTPLAFSEVEAFPSALLAHHYPSVPNLGDMTKWQSWDWDLLSEVDVLVGGTPCQAFSVAGLRAGLEDERGQLTISYIHILDHIDQIRSLYGKEPTICVWENVPGVLSSKDNAFGAFLGGLAGEDCELVPSGGKWTDAGCVYGPKRSVAWRVLDAQYFGVAQRRKRVFVIASAGDFDPSEILFEFDGMRRDTPPSREAGEDTARCFEPRTPDGYARVTEGGVSPTLNTMGGGQREPCVFTTSSFGGYKDGFGTLRANGGDNGGGSESLVIPIHDKATRHGGERGVSNGLGIGQPTDPCPTLDTGGNHAVAFHPTQDPISSQEVTHSMGCGSSSGQASIAVAIKGSMIGREDKNGPQGDGLNEEVSFTLNCVDRHAVTRQMQVRRLTPIECERLQGFPLIEKCGIIWVNILGDSPCSELQKNYANVENQNLKSQLSVGNVEKTGSETIAKYAEQNLQPNDLQIKKPVALSVRINLEQGTLQLLSVEKSSSNVNTAEKSEKCHLLTEIDVSALLNVASLLEWDITLPHGKVGLQQNTISSTAQKNGLILKSLFGNEKVEPVIYVGKNLKMLNDPIRFTTLGATENFPSLDLNRVTSFCSVWDVISSFIPKQILSDYTFGVKFEIRHGYTDVPYRNKPAADGPRYKSLGNSMAVPVMHWIGKRIHDAIN